MRAWIILVTLAIVFPATTISAVVHGQSNPDERTYSDGGFGARNSLLMAPAYQDEGFSCPLLPGCPLGPSVPLPPVPLSTEPSRQGEIVSNPSNLAEGSGKYKRYDTDTSGTF